MTPHARRAPGQRDVDALALERRFDAGRAQLALARRERVFERTFERVQPLASAAPLALRQRAESAERLRNVALPPEQPDAERLERVEVARCADLRERLRELRVVQVFPSWK